METTTNENVGEIHFSYNWNNKLNCRCFTTIRFSNSYNVNGLYKVYLNKKLLGTAKVKAINKIKAISMSEPMCLIDTGYNKEETLKILEKMYQEPITETTTASFITLEMVHRRDYAELLPLK